MVHINKSDNEHHLLRFLSTLRPKHTDIICRSSLFIEKNVIYYYVLHIMYRCRKMSVYQLQWLCKISSKISLSTVFKCTFWKSQHFQMGMTSNLHYSVYHRTTKYHIHSIPEMVIPSF